MLKKIFAGLLVLLTVLPFTAPFPAFDLAHHTPAGTTTVDDGSHALALTAAPRTRTRLASDFDALVVYRYRSTQTDSIILRTALAQPSLSGTSLSVLRI